MTSENVAEITLPSGQICLIDSKNLWLRDTFPSWRMAGNYVKVCRYVKTEFGSVKEEYYVHTLLCKAPPGLQVDHINRNKLDNRECNLRWATLSQNGLNKAKRAGCTSQYRGVQRHPTANKKKPWRAYVRKDKKTHWLGWFASEIEAAKAYDEASERLHGKFAIKNLSPDKEST